MNGTWSVAKKTKAAFKRASRPEKDVEVTFGVAFLPYQGANNFLKITTPDGKIVYEKKFPDGHKTETVKFVYPSSLIKKDKTIFLTMETNVNRHNVINPKQADTHPLGIYFLAVKFDEVSR